MTGMQPAEATLEELSRLAHRVAAGLDQALDAGLPRPRLTLVDDADDRSGLAEIARACLRARRQRDRLFPDGLFADPAWDMLLDLFANEVEGRRVSISDACLAAQAPPTTGLRWVSRLEALGLVARRPDLTDGRRVHLALSAKARQAIEQWLVSQAGPTATAA